jgi:hypothetical protein
MFFFTKRLEIRYGFSKLSLYTASSLFTIAAYVAIPLIALPMIGILVASDESVE